MDERLKNRKWSKTIELTCYRCNKIFLKLKKEYVSQIKRKGIKTKFYCGQECGNKHKIDEFTPFRPYLILAKKNAKDKNLGFDLDALYLKELWNKQKQKCVYSGLEMNLYPSRGEKLYEPKVASLDRIDSKLGYIKGNVQYVCLFMNYAKMAFSDNEIKSLVKEIQSVKL